MTHNEKKAKEGEKFTFYSMREYQAANTQANSEGLRARLEHIDQADDIYYGKWVKNATPSERS